MGGFAEYIYVIPGAQVVKIPDELTNEEVIGACCAFRTAVAAFERLGGMEVQANVVIQGAGPIGLYSLLLYKEGGAGKVIVLGAPKNRLELAQKWGADHVIDIEDMPDTMQRGEQIRSWTQGLGPDVVVEASGGPTAFPEGLEMVRSGGKYIVIGQTRFDVDNTIKPALIVIKHLDIRGSVSAVVSHYYRALQFIKNKRDKYSFADIVTSKHTLDRAADALEAMESGQGIKPVVVP
jgi:threonine dehydrogenase-like Zn-dependent dehydrogenase